MPSLPTTLFKFQTKAIDQATAALADALADSTPKAAPFKFALRAPTGSGKTLMMLQTIQNLLAKDPSLIVLWLASKNLAAQTATRLQRTMTQQSNTAAIPYTHVQGLQDLQFQPGRLYILHWENCNTATHLLIRPNEQGLNLSGFLQEARNANSPLLVVVDEAHAIVDSADANGRALVYDTIAPRAIFGASASFTSTQLDDYSLSYKVDRAEVVASGLIVNDTLAYCIPTATDSELLQSAHTLQQELAAAYAQEGAGVSPLILVQVPNSVAGADAVATTLSVFGKAGYREGIEVRTHFSGSPTELTHIADHDSPVKVLLFKIGLATGWDCPRAKILVALRDTKSAVLNIQVLGRIARQPEARAYANNRLNRAYLFTSLAGGALLKEVDRLKKDDAALRVVYESGRALSVQPAPVPLGQHWLPATRIASTLRSSANYTHAIESLLASMSSQTWDFKDTADAVTLVSLEHHTSEIATVGASTSEALPLLMAECESLAHRHLQKLKTPFDSALAADVVRTFFLHLQDYALTARQVSNDVFLTSWKNPALCHQVHSAFDAYLHAVVTDDYVQPAQIDWAHPQTWSLPEVLYTTDSSPSHSLSLRRSAVQDACAVPIDSNLERDFIQDCLEDSLMTPALLWWLKNPRTAGHLAIPYILNGSLRHYVPDFILVTKTTTGHRIFVLDTKDTHTAATPEALEKHQALTQWAAAVSTPDLPVTGGFVQRKNSVWWLHAGATLYDEPTGLNPSTATGWTDLVLALKS